MPTPTSARTRFPTTSALDRVGPLHEVHIITSRPSHWTRAGAHISGGCPFQSRLNRRPVARIGCVAGRGAPATGKVSSRRLGRQPLARGACCDVQRTRKFVTQVTQSLSRGTPAHDPHHGGTARSAHDVAVLRRRAGTPAYAASDRVHRFRLGRDRDRARHRRHGVRSRRGGHFRVSARCRCTCRALDLTVVRIADAPLDHPAALADAEDRKHWQ